MTQQRKTKILVCGILPPPNFGHSMMYKMLMESEFVSTYDITFLELKFWSYAKHKKVTFDKIFKMIKYWFALVFLMIVKRPRYVLFNMSFDRMPFLKDYLFCVTASLLGARVVLHDMGQYLPELNSGAPSWMQRLIAHLLKRTYAIIVMGEKVKTDYAPFFDPSRILVVPGCVEDTAFLPTGESKQEGKTQILYFSYLSTTKGIWTALKAMPLVIAQDPQVFFTFAGPMESETLKDAIYKYVKEHQLEAYFTYVGYVEDVFKRTTYFRSCDIFIFPTLRDVFGLVLLHAMAESKPVVASIEGTIPEIITDGVNGALFEKGNEYQLAQKILSLTKDDLKRHHMGQANRQKYLSHYAPEVYGKHMIDVFKKLA